MSGSGPRFKKIAIIGVGLIGGSLGRKCRSVGLAGEVVGVGRGVKNLEHALALGAIESYTHDPARGVEGADLVVLATPVGSFRAIVEKARPRLIEGAIVTDVGSVKGALVETLESCMPPGVHFVGAHPMAGKEKAGAAHSDPELFRGARCILTPTGKTDARAVDMVKALWERAGSRVTIMDPYEHDALLASTSHLPHLAACSLVTAVKELNRNSPQTLSYCGTGFKDTTRVASSPPEVWRDICLYNREQLLNAIRKFQRVLREAETRIAEGDGEALMNMFQQAKSFRDKL